MAFPSKLKKSNLFQDGISFLAETKTVKLPALKRLSEGYRGSGMSGELDSDNGHDKLELEFTLGGLVPEAISAWGKRGVSATQYRFAGAYENIETGATTAVEVVIRGRCTEIDFGDAEAGKDTDHAYKVTCAYYKLIIGGRDMIEIDVLRGIEIVNGVDLTAETRAAIGA
ncbi:MAG: major tail tube protein [Phage 64_12]|nr:phage major tail tube protein [Xanthomonadales bacterium]QOR55668.1 MAG: major tail tube protein [Phage 64_12]